MALFDIICVFFVLLPILAAAVSGQFGRASLGIASGTILSAGVAGTFIGNIQILARLDDPTALPAALSVSLLTSLYAALVKVVLDVVQSKKPAPAPVHPGPYGAVAAALCLVTFVCAIVLGTPVFTFVSALATALFVLGIALIALLGMGSEHRKFKALSPGNGVPSVGDLAVRRPRSQGPGVHTQPARQQLLGVVTSARRQR